MSSEPLINWLTVDGVNSSDAANTDLEELNTQLVASSGSEIDGRKNVECITACPNAYFKTDVGSSVIICLKTNCKEIVGPAGTAETIAVANGKAWSATKHYKLSEL